VAWTSWLKFSRTAAVFAQGRHWDDEGFVSPYQWIRLNCKMGGGAAGQRITVGENTQSLPRSIEAMEAGEIGFAHLTQMASLCRTLSESKMGAVFSEKPLLEQAKLLNVREFTKACQLARTVSDPRGHELEQWEQTLRQSFWMKQSDDGMWLGKFLLNNENGAALNVVIKALSKKSGVGDNRSQQLRQAWALAEMVQYTLRTRKMPATNHQVPHLQITASLDSLLGVLGAPGGIIEDGHPINAETLRRIACDSTITRVVLAGDSSVLDLGQLTRCVSAPLRRAVELRDHKCQWPGCDRGASWTEAHHVISWVKGGKTDKDNIVLLCYRHHYLVHEGKWVMVLKENREVVVIPPTYRSIVAA